VSREDPWLEERHGATTTFELDGIDVAANEEAELAHFRKVGRSVGDIGVIFGFAILAVGWIVLLSQMALQIAVPLIVAGMLAMVVAGVWQRIRETPPATTRSRFVVKCEPGALSIECGARRSLIELADIDRFEVTLGGIEVARRDGRRDKLPFKFKDRANNESFARRLEDAVTDARTGTGYRGVELESEEVEQSRRRGGA